MRIAAAQLAPMMPWLSVLGLLAAVPLAGQDREHAILGTVRDTALQGLPGIEVVLLSPRRSTLTDGAGRFRFDSVPGGLRHLLIRRIGYLAVHPSVEVPQADTLRAILLPAPQNLPPLIVESELPGIRGVVGDTAYHALPGTLVQLLGAGLADTTDEQGRFAFEKLRQGHYVLRVSRADYLARLLSIELDKKGLEYSIFLEAYHRGMFDWANTIEAASALVDLGSRLATEPRRNRMTREELERYGTTALCDIPRLRVVVTSANPDPYILLRGVILQRNASLCAWSADEVDLLEWGADPCLEAAKTIASVLGLWCGPTRGQSFGNSGRQTSRRRPGYVVLWPRS